MATIILPFNFDLNISAQIGDTAYYVTTTTNSGFDINSSAIVEIGVITSISVSTNTITCETSLLQANYPSTGDFIMFSKDNKANMTSILGYYAEVQIRNNSKTEAEMFKINADYFESSK